MLLRTLFRLWILLWLGVAVAFIPGVLQKAAHIQFGPDVYCVLATAAVGFVLTTVLAVFGKRLLLPRSTDLQIIACTGLALLGTSLAVATGYSVACKYWWGIVPNPFITKVMLEVALYGLAFNFLAFRRFGFAGTGNLLLSIAMIIIGRYVLARYGPLLFASTISVIWVVAMTVGAMVIIAVLQILMMPYSENGRIVAYMGLALFLVPRAMVLYLGIVFHLVVAPAKILSLMSAIGLLGFIASFLF